MNSRDTYSSFILHPSSLLTHPSRSIRTCGTFIMVLLGYWVYGLAAVPLIEPEAEISSRRGAPPVEAKQPAERRTSEIDVLFGPEDWERRDPVVLENQRGKLLVGKYKNNEDGSVEIWPCTMIMLPEGDFPSEQERIRQAVVLQADKASLQFDQPFDIRKASIGKLVAGTLQGPIVIRSDQKQPGPHDDLSIETSDIELKEESIATDNAVKFRWGPHHGSGRQMRIDLVKAADGAGRPRGPQVDGLKALTLFRDVRLHLVPDEKLVRGATHRHAATPPADKDLGAARWRPLPIEVTCQGPFRFDLQQRLATFEDAVHVLQIQPNGPSDQLSGELLAIHFAPKDAAPGAPPGPSDQGKERLQPTHLKMQGNPVMIRSTINAVQARGQQLDYDLPARRLSLAGEPEVIVTRAGDEIRARELHYQPGENGRLGKLLAVGPGWLSGKMQDQPQRVEAHWTRQLWIRPDPEAPQLDVVSLEGAAEARVPGMGGLKAEEIFCWLFERPAGQGAQAKSELAPDRLLANGQVHIDSPQLVGATDRLETWFEHRPVATPAAAAAPGSIATAGGTGPAPAASAARPRRPAERRFDVSGKLFRLKLAMTGREADLSELMIEGQARFAEIPSMQRQSPQPPMLVEGERLQVVQADPQQATVTVTGQPAPERWAHVEAGGLGLRGATIKLSRGSNQLWIDGAGKMTMQVDRDMQGRPLERPQPLEVDWQDGMIFNGLTASFEHRVVARTQQQMLQTGTMEITLSRRVDFSQPKQDQRPDLAEVVCRGGVILDSKTYDEQGLASIEHMETADLTINRITGAIHASAFSDPKRQAVMVQWRRGDNRAGLGLPGASREAGPEDKAGEGISYLHVRFRHALEGNLNNRQIAFGKDVRTVYGPVPSWDAVLTEDSLGERGILLTCDRMVVQEISQAASKERATELEAIGNISIEGLNDTFRATAATMRYSSEKGKLILDGEGRRSVQFFRKLPSGSSQSGSARRVEYTPSQQHFHAQEFRSGTAIEPPK